MIDRTRQWETKGGKQVRIYSTEAGGTWTVHGAVAYQTECSGQLWQLHGWNKEGKSHESETYNLVEAKKRITIKRFMNVYSDGQCNDYLDRKMADEYASPVRFACVEITREVVEGEGLSK